ncbi:EAL domain-containing protein [Amphritea sp. 1_MG-2023]|uniref:bifunctional diguanylate cyclase/phosphodiesterase n=1 Tax=Amphritea sp. 1_MG-2023 TaxID=3062670 RepID=UPI0026E397AE|nr:EAL domain-containing protein [Amphritea sp. 1_MG-2023]MDO6561852.1 EAL domain-containing protein [Amphritea sp. 1_MG-2023]
MNVSKKMSWIVVLSSLAVLLPALIVFYFTAKKELLETELAAHQVHVQALADEFASDLHTFSVKLEKLDRLINRQLLDRSDIDVARFDRRMSVSPDGAWRNTEETYSGHLQAGLFLPPDYNITVESKRFYGRMFDIFESFGVATSSEKVFNNIWFLDHHRAELIYDRVFPDFVYRMTPDTDYTATDWMTLASPERNPQRQTQWTPPLFDPTPASWMVSAVHPLDIDGVWVGTLGQDIQLNRLFSLMHDSDDKFAGEQHILRDKKGDFILAGPWQGQLEGKAEPFTIDKQETELLTLLTHPLSNVSTLLGEVSMQGQSYQVIGVLLQPMGWRYLHLIPTDAILANLVKVVYTAALFFVFTAVAISLLINGAVRKVVSKPIEQLVLRTRLFAIGLKPEPIADWGSIEMTELALAVDMMKDDLDREANRLAHMATHDELTGLPNRNLLNDRLEQVIVDTKRNKTKAAILFLDLDQFKNVNDSLGHSLGDQLLKTVAERIALQLPEDSVVSRFGGDEFVVLIPKFEHMFELSNIAGELLFIIQQPYLIEGYDLSITSSIGISVCPDDSDIVETLIQNADAAMYQSKKLGRNGFKFHTQDIREQILRKRHLEDALRKALDDQQFVLYYQPKVNFKTKQIVGMEALIRWQHPQMGIVSPLEFIPLAEETGLIIEIGEWVIQTACMQMKTWSEQYPWLDNMAINLSVRQFQQQDFCQRVELLLTEKQIDSSKIDFEITESMIMEDVEAAIRILAQLRMLGVSISIDDFGTGYSSLSYLKHLPADSLKIDRAFIKEIVHDANDQAITKSIIALATNLNLSVIAEGIEDAEQDTMLTDMGCDYAQGYYFSRPLPAEELSLLLAQQDEHSAETPHRGAEYCQLVESRN